MEINVKIEENFIPIEVLKKAFFAQFSLKVNQISLECIGHSSLVIFNFSCENFRVIQVQNLVINGEKNAKAVEIRNQKIFLNLELMH